MYNVGQILYTILEDANIVLPVKVIEQTITKNLKGETINFKITLPDSNNKTYTLAKLKNVYNDLDEVNNILLERAKDSVNKIITEARTLESVFKDDIPACINDPNEDIVNENNDQKENLELNTNMKDAFDDQKKNESEHIVT